MEIMVYNTCSESISFLGPKGLSAHQCMLTLWSPRQTALVMCAVLIIAVNQCLQHVWLNEKHVNRAAQAQRVSLEHGHCKRPCMCTRVYNDFGVSVKLSDERKCIWHLQILEEDQIPIPPHLNKSWLKRECAHVNPELWVPKFKVFNSPETASMTGGTF